ncbi:MAG: AmmeMemoRadiSam system protein B [Treponema sp.]|jgi:AmmeMemoRadiSam system protein B|nr:AmmeMemoRadiSam system protein B [Treponema sp.]
MNIRPIGLPPGWYPDAARIKRFLSPFGAGRAGNAPAALSPHAGWYYAGEIEARAAASLDRDAVTVAVLGGHLPAGCPALFAEEDAVETPLGTISIDAELRAALRERVPHQSDIFPDNTVEVLLPMVKWFFPDARLLWVRLPASAASFAAGKALAECAAALGRRTAVLGSTDLTHYGAAYGFSPAGSGARALAWARENDRAFLDAVRAEDAAAVLRLAAEKQAACSPGAVLGTLGFVQGLREAGTGGLRVTRTEYGSSADRSEEGAPESFVGYGGAVWTKTQR